MLKRAHFTGPCLALLALAPGLAAQQPLPAGDVVDQVLAIVGDSTILRSQIEEEIQRMRLQQAPVPPPEDPAYSTFFNGILDSWVNRILVLNAAAQDTLIRPDEARIEQQVSGQIQELIESFGSRPQLTQALAAEGLSLVEYRDILTAQARQQQVQQLFIQTKMRDARPVDVSEDELLARFQEARRQLQQRPKLVTFRQVVVAPDPSEEARAAAREEAEDLLRQIRNGADFAELARRRSDDPGSAQLGGDLGWFRRGRMVQEFEDVAFRLQEGAVSNVVETDFGYHIIQIQRTRSGERQGRHILIVPEKSEEDVKRAEQLAADILAQVRAGASIDSLYTEHSDMAVPDSLTVSYDQIAELPEPYTRLRTATSGELVGPLHYRTQADDRFAVIQVEEVREAGAYTFEDVKAQLAAQIQQEKRLERVLEDLRERTYIQILR